VGVVDYSQIMSQHPKVQAASSEMQTAVQEAQKEFEEKSANMNDNEKRDYYTQTQQRLQQKNQELMEPITKNVEESVKKVAEQKGLSVVLDKGAVVYGGVDITQDVLKQVSK
jgi:outer membrane protein